MKKKRSSFVTMGIPSLFLIFSVLCLAVLSLLTLGTSRTDLGTSRLSMEQTAAYYDSCSKATDLCSSIQNRLADLYTEADGEAAYYSALEDLPEEIAELSVSENTRLLSFNISISESQQLHVELTALYPVRDEDPFFRVLTWKTEACGTWNPDTKQPVFKGESS